MTAKIAISLPDELVEAARQAVRLGHAASVSAYIAAAVEDYRSRPTLQQLLDQWDEELGPVPEDVKRDVDAQIAAAERQWAACYEASDQAAGQAGEQASDRAE